MLKHWYLEVLMKGKMSLVILLMLVGSYANAVSVLVGNGISWTSSIVGVGTDTGTITLNADVSGSTFSSDAYLGGVGIKNLGASDNSSFKITSVSLTNWDANNAEMGGKPAGACAGGGSSSSKRACAFASSPGDRPSSAGDLTIVLGVTFDSGGVLSNTFHFKPRWEDLDGKNKASLISDDLSAVPIPAAAWLFGSALVGLVVVARRRDLRTHTRVA
jgi:hypothetical protein